MGFSGPPPSFRPGSMIRRLREEEGRRERVITGIILVGNEVLMGRHGRVRILVGNGWDPHLRII